ncbi:hypothetical protein [Herbiconiux ginsengi]|uniref:hypothetical protein n=1 Tax=Herbiconiux ginsengi TaxID=381665 RepID=UPI001114E93D|nr:hypothetical protein [Herbiconiux ginsengi]
MTEKPALMKARAAANQFPFYSATANGAVSGGSRNGTNHELKSRFTALEQDALETTPREIVHVLVDQLFNMKTSDAGTLRRIPPELLDLSLVRSNSRSRAGVGLVILPTCGWSSTHITSRRALSTLARTRSAVADTPRGYVG